MRIHALLLDLDDTLIPDESASEAAFLAACAPVADRYGLDPAAVAHSAGACARQVWHASDHIAYGQSIGISSWEGLWADFTGDAPELQRLHAWAPAYRREAWTRALARHGVDDPAFAEHLANRFRHERRRRNVMFPDAAQLLPQFARRLPLALVTNGAPDLQHFKIDASGVRPYFQSIVVSGEVGIGKPHTAPMQRALRELNCDPTHAAMVGDNLSTDIAGALNADVHAIWLNRDATPFTGDIRPDAVVASLYELPGLIR
ncbi:MAG: HAD family hydrolase [Chloroflexota bacterium]|nr:HAD family hydrolase [Chloroflexota bacterium]MDE2921224.1 HAD family hydrolase [Chloroflexota bacterium]